MYVSAFVAYFLTDSSIQDSVYKSIRAERVVCYIPLGEEKPTSHLLNLNCFVLQSIATCLLPLPCPPFIRMHAIVSFEDQFIVFHLLHFANPKVAMATHPLICKQHMNWTIHDTIFPLYNLKSWESVEWIRSFNKMLKICSLSVQRRNFFSLPKFDSFNHILNPRTKLCSPFIFSNLYSIPNKRWILPAHCYEKVKKETEEIQTKIQEELKLDPVEKDVVILYDGEKDDRVISIHHVSNFTSLQLFQQPEIVNGKRIVEMKKPRPMWFSKNLIQKSTQQNTANKPIKPDDLV